MMTDLRLPNITGTTEKEQLTQLKSYLHQLVGQLQWALNSTVTPGQNVVSVSSSNSSQKVLSQTEEEKNTAAKFAEVKALIIKTAEIVDAYYEEIDGRLVGMYEAVSDFGRYSEETELTLSKTSTDIEQVYSNIQKIVTDIENLNFTLAEVNAHIKSGLLGEDENGLPIYGLEVGQRNNVDGVEVFNKFARFTADRLSFYDKNGVEVAYISDYKLYITHAEVTGTLKLGGYRVDTTSGLAFKWVGRS